MDLQLQGKRILITGGSKGIGISLAHAFAAEGCSLVLVSRDKEKLEAAAGEVRRAHNAKVEAFAADLSTNAERERVFAAVPDVDILVNNAGAIPGGSILDLTMERWMEAWSLKVLGYIHMTKLFIEPMMKRKHGTIINIIGMGGAAPKWDYVCGTAGNASLIAFTKAIGSRSTDGNVRVVAINPPATRTDRIETMGRTWAKSKFGDENKWKEALRITEMPFGRMAEPDEMAALAVMLASPKVHYLSGLVIDADGGNMYRSN